jgi:hypothetical protein
MDDLAESMLRMAGDLVAAQEKRVYLRDYLQPGGRRPYRSLAGDLEKVLAGGDDVVLIDVPGFRMVTGYADMADGPRPWYADRKWFKTAADALAGRGGRR